MAGDGVFSGQKSYAAVASGSHTVSSLSRKLWAMNILSLMRQNLCSVLWNCKLNYGCKIEQKGMYSVMMAIPNQRVDLMAHVRLLCKIKKASKSSISSQMMELSSPNLNCPLRSMQNFISVWRPTAVWFTNSKTGKQKAWPGNGSNDMHSIYKKSAENEKWTNKNSRKSFL